MGTRPLRRCWPRCSAATRWTARRASPPPMRLCCIPIIFRLSRCLSAYWSWCMKDYKWFYETCRAIARVLVLLLIRLRVNGVENVPATGPVIPVSNHLNWTDIPMIGLRLKRLTHFMAKAELFQKPPIKWLVIGLGAFPVRRGEADRQAIKQADEVLKAGQVLVIFPEGTRSR